MLTQRVTITIYPDVGDAFGMVFWIPIDRDYEEYVDEMLSKILSGSFPISDWEFD